MKDNFRKSSSRRSIALKLPHVDMPQESLDELRTEVAELRASRTRLAVAVDTDRRSIERALHDGPQQQLVALAVNLQLASELVSTDLVEAKGLLDEMGRDVQQALDETAKLAQRIYPPLLEAGGLGAALRAAALRTGARVEIEVTGVAGCPPAIAGAAYFCCLEVLEHSGDGARATIEIRVDDGALLFDVVASGGALPTSLAAVGGDRVEALGGRLTIRPEPGGGRVSGSLPLGR